MDAMKEALKRKMMEMKAGHHGAAVEHGDAETDLDDDPAKSGSDAAPSLEHKVAMGVGGDDRQMPGIGGGAAPEDMMHPDHMAMLKAFSGSHHLGRGGSSLSERVSDKAKEKMASIEKHKKDKGY